MKEGTTTKRRTLSLPITDTGTLDWDSVRGSTAQKLLNLLQSDSKLASEYDEARGLTADAENEPDLFGGVTQENIHSLIDWIGQTNATLLQLVAAKWMKHPLGLKDENGKQLTLFVEPDILQMMQFDAKQHEELDPRALRIAKKYEHKMPSWLRQHFDVYMFASMFVAYTAQNAKTVLETQTKRDLKRIQENFSKMKAAEQSRKNPPPTPPSNGVDAAPPLEFFDLGSAPSGESETPTA